MKRRDWLHTIGEEIWRSLLWFHPHAHVIATKLSLAREMVVDEQTILITRDRRAYAEALLAFSNPQPHVIGVTPFIGRRTLSQRISLIAEEVSMSRRRALACAAVAFAACIGVSAAAVDRFPMFATLQAQSTVLQAGQRCQPAHSSEGGQTRLHASRHGRHDPGVGLADSASSTKMATFPMSRSPGLSIRNMASIRRQLRPPGNGNSSPGVRMGRQWLSRSRSR